MLTHTFSDLKGWTPVLEKVTGQVSQVSSAERDIARVFEQQDAVVLVYAVWNTHDIRLAQDAVAFTEGQGRKYILFLAPFDDEETLGRWLGHLDKAQGGLCQIEQTKVDGKRLVRIVASSEDHPVLIRVRNGEVVSSLVGKRLLHTGAFKDFLNSEH